LTQLGNIWAILILFSVSSFAIISVIIIFKGYGEIKDIFKKLGGKGERIQ
jgi:hypothetical protein